MPVDIFETPQFAEERRVPRDIFAPEEVPILEEKPLEEIPVTEERRRPILRLPTREEGIEGLQNYLKAGGNLAKSVGMGVLNDVIKVHNFFANHPTARSILMPFRGEMEKIPEIQLERAPMPGVARATELMAPAFIPAVGEEALVGKAIQGGSHLLPRMLPYAEAIGRTMGRVGARGTYGGAQLAALEKIFGDEEPEENVKNAAIAGAVLNTVPRAFFHAVPFGLRGLVNHFKKYARETGRIPSPEEAQTIMNAMGNEDVLTFADLVQSPKLRSFYHGFLKHVPFSGVKPTQAKQMATMEKEATNTFNNLLHGVSPDDFVIRENIADKIKDISKARYDKATDLYDNLYNAAEKAKEKFIFVPEIVRDFRDTVTKKAQEAGKTLGEYLKPAQLKALDDLDDTLYYKKVAIKGAKPRISFKAVADLRSKYSKEVRAKLGTTEGRFWRGLVEAMDKDTERAAEKSGLSHLTQLKKEASDYYRDDVVPFTKKKDIVSILRKDIDFNEKTLENTLRDTRNKKVLESLPLEERNRITRLLLDDKIPNNAEYASARIVDAYKGLSPYEKKVMLPSQTKEKLDSLTKNYEILKPSLDLAKESIWNSLRRMWQAGHEARLAGLGAIGALAVQRGKALPTLAGITLPGIVAGRLLGHPQLARAYAYGERVPTERLAERVTGITTPIGRALALEEMGGGQ